MKIYDSYKDSGIEWIGVIPENWNKTYLKYCMSKIYGGGTPTTSEETYWSENEADIPWVAISDISSCDKELYLTKKKITEEGRKSKNLEIIPKGTLLLSIFASLGKTVRLGIDSTVNQAILGLEPNEKLHPKFLEFLLVDIERYISQFSTSSTQENLNLNKIKNLFFYIPNSIEEQTKIINYLDQKTTQIDHLISKKEQFIQLLEEERVAVINQAVTKGLDPNVSMKDSGIEWLGEIPEHWEVKKLRFIGNCQNGISAGAEYFGTGYPFVSYGDVYKNEILPISVNGLAQSNEKEQLHYSIDEGDVLFTRTSETIEEIGISSICFQKIHKAVFAGFLIRFRPNEGTLNKNFSKYFFRSKIPRTFFVKEMNLVTRASLSQELLKRLPILLPSIDEQKNIGEFLNKKTNDIDDIVGKTRKEIELLKEYKTALISEVVTGKVDVRNEKLN